MKLLTTWDTLRTRLEEFDLPPYLVKAVRWVELHPRAVLTTSLMLVMAVLLAQTPPEQPLEHDPYNDETPLFV